MATEKQIAARRQFAARYGYTRGEEPYFGGQMGGRGGKLPMVFVHRRPPPKKRSGIRKWLMGLHPIGQASPSEITKGMRIVYPAAAAALAGPGAIAGMPALVRDMGRASAKSTARQRYDRWMAKQKVYQPSPKAMAARRRAAIQRKKSWSRQTKLGFS